MRQRVLLFFIIAVFFRPVYSIAQNTPWTTSGSIGIGTTSPSAPLHINTTSQNTGLIIDDNTGVRSPTLGFYANGLPKSFVQLDRGTGDLLFLTNAGATSALRLSYSTGNATFGGSGSFGATLTVGTNNVNNGYAGVNAILINGYNSGQSILSSNAGSSTNYNGLSIASNYTNSNSLPAWSIDLGGNQNTTTNPDAFTIGRRPSGGSWNSLFTVSNAGAGQFNTTTDQGLTISKTGSSNWNYIGFMNGGSRKLYIGLDNSNNAIIGSDVGTPLQVVGGGGLVVNGNGNFSGSIVGTSGQFNITGDQGLTISKTGSRNWNYIGFMNGGSRKLYIGLDNNNNPIIGSDIGNPLQIVGGGGMNINGNVGIGTTAPTEKLSVNGNIKTQKLIVTQTGWSDYVFAPGYQLKPLIEVGKFIHENRHLPDIPSEKEVKEKGMDVGENQALLLKKIEELTLYIIELDKKNKRQQKQIDQLLKEKR